MIVAHETHLPQLFQAYKSEIDYYNVTCQYLFAWFDLMLVSRILNLYAQIINNKLYSPIKFYECLNIFLIDSFKKKKTTDNKMTSRTVKFLTKLIGQ